MPNPTEFKQLLISKYPNGVAADGRRYADIPDEEITKMVVNKYPDGVTSAGIKYADYLGTKSETPKVEAQPKKQEFVSNVKNYFTGQGPLLPASENPSAKEAVLKIAVNTPLDFAQTMVKFPYDVAKAAFHDIPKEAVGLVRESGGIKQAAKNFYNADGITPKSIYESFVPSATQKIFKGDFQGAARDLINQPFKEISPYVLLAEKAKPGFVSKTAKPVIDTVKDYKSGIGQAIEGHKEIRQQKAIQGLSDAYREVAGQTKNPTKLLSRAEARGKDPIKVLSERGITPEVRDGKIHSLEKANSFRESAQPLNEHLNLALDEVQPGIPKTPVDVIRQRALSRINDLKNITESSRQGMIKDANLEFNLIKQKYGNSITLKQVNNVVKKPAWSDTKFDATKPHKGETNYNIGKAAQETIENSVPKEAVDIHQLNSHIGDVYEGAKFLESLDGRAVKGGRMGKYFARTAGTVIGSSGGPFGSIAGLLGGELIAEIFQRKTFGGPLRQRILRNLAVKDPIAYKQVLEFLKRSGQEREGRLALPAPRPLGSSENPIIPPAPTTYEKATPGFKQPTKLLKSGEVIELPRYKTPKGGLSLKALDPDDLATMSDFTDYVAKNGGYKPDPVTAHQLELDAARIAEVLGIKEYKSLNGLADAFGRYLEATNFPKPGFKKR